MKYSKNSSIRPALLLGMLGCLLMGGSDWLMIYGDTAYEGNLAWLTVGAAEIAPWRNTLAMALAFPAVICYGAALLALRHLIDGETQRRRYVHLTLWGMTPWLALHLLYIIILYLFGWMQHSGMEAQSFAACEALFGHIAWVIFAGEALMLLPFLYWLGLTLKGRTPYGKWMALNNPLVLYVVLKVLTGFFPDCAARLAWTNGLMSESMILWFAILLLGLPKEK